jgi:hypothetical protein
VDQGIFELVCMMSFIAGNEFQQNKIVSQSDRIHDLEAELAETKRTLELLIDAIQKDKITTPEIQVVLDDHCGRIAGQVANIEQVRKIITEISDFLDRNDDLAALRHYHQVTNATWDRCHDVIGGWLRLNDLQRREAVSRDLRQRVPVSSF